MFVEEFRREVLDFLVAERAISKELRSRMLEWRHSGFSVHNRVRVAAEDPQGRTKLAGYMLRAPLSLAKMSYDAGSGTVIYRSKMRLGFVHLECWQPEAPERAPPVAPEAWPAHASLALTYHPVPDIA